MSLTRPASASDARSRAVAGFRGRWKEEPTHLLRVPGSAPLLGGYTDDHEGYALSFAADRAVWLAFRRREDGRVRLAADGSTDHLDGLPVELADGVQGWAACVRATLWAVTSAGVSVNGWEGYVATELDGHAFGAATALQMAVLRACVLSVNGEWQPVAAAQLARRAAAERMGSDSGPAAPLAVTMGQPEMAHLVDCRTLEVRHVPLPPDFVFWHLDAPGTLPVAVGPQRRDECAPVLRRLGLASLRDTNLSTFAVRGLEFPEPARRRARHIVTENERVLQGARAMGRGDGESLGILMNVSHNSLRDDYEAGDSGSNVLAQVARTINGCAGARMAGRVPGVICVVAAWASAAFLEQVRTRCREWTGRDVVAMPLRATGGVEVEDLATGLRS